MGEEVVTINYNQGDIVKVQVIGVTKDYIFVDLKSKSEGIIPREELFEEKVKVGDIIEATIVRITDEGEVYLSQKLAYSKKLKNYLYQAYQNRLPVEGKVININKGGFEVELGTVVGFCPFSQIELGRCENPEQYIGKIVYFLILEYNEEEGKVILSRKAFLEEEAKRKAEETLKKLAPGKIVEGEVVSLKPYGAFVDLGGIQGLVHISEISHIQVEDPSQVLTLGQKVKAKILSVEGRGKPKDIKVALSIKALEPHPWELAKDKFQVGQIVEGVVKNITNFGAFVEIDRGVEGLVPLIEICDEHINHPREKLSKGDKVKVKILETNWEEKKLTLSIREAVAELGEKLIIAVGEVVKVRVVKPKLSGLIVQILGAGKKGVGFIPLEECDVTRGEELRNRYPVGKSFDAEIISVDKENGRIKLSIKRLIEREEEKEVEELKNKYQFEGSLSTLGDFLKTKNIKINN